MYNGIKRKGERKYNIVIPTECQVIELEECETNGIVSKQYKIRTKDFKSDPNIKYTDFEVNNLIAAGIDPREQAEVKLSPSIDKLMHNAETTNEVLEQMEIINAVRSAQTQNQKPQENE